MTDPLTAFGRLAAFLIVAGILLAAPYAFAADSETTINLSGLWSIIAPYLSTAADVVIAGIISWFASLAHKWFGLTIEARHREALHSAAMTGAGLALSRIGERTVGHAVDVRSAAVAQVVNWIIRSVPDAVAYLGASPDKLRVIAEAKLAEAGWQPDAAPDSARAS